ncbi:MAG: DUF4129 domain-containing protein [Symbiobacteriia bacterium]
MTPSGSRVSSRRLILAGSLVMEFAAWRPWSLAGAAWIYGADAGRGSTPTGWAEVAALAGGAYLLSLLQQRAFSPGHSRTAMVLAGLVAAALLAAVAGAGAPGYAFFSILFFWWRGILALQYHRSHEELAGVFPRLVLWQLALLLLPAAAAVQTMLTAIFGLFTAGLLSLAVSQLLAVRQTEGYVDRGDGRRFGWRPVTVVLLMAAAGGVFLLGRILAGPAFPGFKALFVAALTHILDAAASLIMPVALVIGRILEPIIRWIAAFAHAHRTTSEGVANGNPADSLFPHVTPRELPALLVYMLRWGGLAGLALLAVLIVLRSIAPVFLIDDADVPEDRERLRPDEGLSTEPKRRRQRQRSAEESPLAAIRRVYRQFQSLLGNRGLPRAAAETPAEYLHRLTGAYPAWTEWSARLTALYMKARYGPESLSAAEEGEAARALSDLERAAASSPRQSS